MNFKNSIKILLHKSAFMVEAKVTTTATRSKKFLWTGTKLPSSGCLLTVLTFVGYRDEIKPLILSLCRAGAPYYQSHVEKSRAFRDDKLRLFPKQNWASVKPRSLHTANVELMGNMFVNSSRQVRVKETDQISPQLVDWLT